MCLSMLLLSSKFKGNLKHAQVIVICLKWVYGKRSRIKYEVNFEGMYLMMADSNLERKVSYLERLSNGELPF